MIRVADCVMHVNRPLRKLDPRLPKKSDRIGKLAIAAARFDLI
jgi:hypothetical protein